MIVSKEELANMLGVKNGKTSRYSAYYIITELINALRLGEIGTDGAVDILEKVLLILDGVDPSEKEMERIVFTLRGETA